MLKTNPITKLLLSLSLLNNLPSIFSSTCPSNCRCDSSYEVINCSNKDLTKLPTGLVNLQDTVTQLTLDGNNFEDEDGDILDDIGDLTKLRKLSVQNSKIKVLTYDLFDNLDDLIVLKLARNQIISVDDDTFEWNPLKLEIVDMSHNQIRYIQHFLFYDLTSLQEISLNNNKIAFVHPHAFQKLTQLRRLDLSENHLHTFNPMWVRPLKNAGLQSLNFEKNPWSCDCSNEAARDFLNENYWVKDLIDQYPIKCKATDSQLDLFDELSQYQNKKLTDTGSKKLPCSPPRIVGISKSSTIEAGKSVLLKCIAQGLPQPSISWIAPDQDVYRFNNNNYEGVEVNEDGNLKITDLAKSDEGDYICQATNFQSSEEDDDEDDEDESAGNNVAQVRMTLTIGLGFFVWFEWFVVIVFFDSIILIKNLFHRRRRQR